MKKSVLIILAIFSGLVCGAQFKGGHYSDLNDSETVAAFKEHISYLSAVSLEGRQAGSEGETLAAEYVGTKLQAYGITLLSPEGGDIFGISQENGDTLVSRNVVACIPGYDKTLRDNYIVIGARLDGPGVLNYTLNGEAKSRVLPGANGNASGLAMLLELAHRLSQTSLMLKRSVLIVAFGASSRMNAGSWYFLNRSFPDVPRIDAMINLDMVGTASSGFYAYTSSNRDMNAILNQLDQSLQPIKPKLVSLEPVGSDHRSFYDKRIPSVFFTTGRYPEYNTGEDTASIIEYEDMEREMEYVYNYTVALASGDKPAFDPGEASGRDRPFSADIVPYSDCDVKPVFLGSSDPAQFLKKWVYVYLKYPEAAVRDGIQGRVLVDFVIDEKGKVRDVRIARGVDPLLDEEALRVIKASPDWKAARVGGKKVKCGLSLYVEFRLERKKNR